MRIDVDRDLHRMEVELDLLYERHLARPGRPGLERLPVDAPPRFRLYRRIADGEWHVYVEDVLQQRLAGCTVFNRLPGLDRRLDAHVRSPHSRLRPAYQRRGLATLIYRHALDAGLCLISGARQSPAAHRLWQSLGRRYALSYVRLEDRGIVDLGAEVDEDVFDELDTRLLLCGAGWDAASLAGQ